MPGRTSTPARSPTEEEGDPEELAVGDAVVSSVTEFFVANLRQHRIHHQQQAECDRQRDGPDSELVETVVQARTRAPRPRPAAIATPIQSGRNRSRVESFATTPSDSGGAGVVVRETSAAAVIWTASTDSARRPPRTSCSSASRSRLAQ